MIIRHLSIDCAYINKVLEPITQREHGVTEFEIEIKNHGADIDLSECTLATYYGLKPDEHKVGVECRVDKDKGLIYLPLYLQMTTAEGVLKGIVELQFPEGNVRFSGVNFKVSFAPDDTKGESTDDFNVLENFISKPTTDGVVGQVLSIDSDGNTIWRTLKEFDGDYAHLIHKPSINGVELNGDKSLEDLNIKQTYTADDIPFTDGETFQQKFNNGELKGQDGVSGADGIGITNAEINASGELTLTYSNGTSANLGKVVGADENTNNSIKELKRYLTNMGLLVFESYPYQWMYAIKDIRVTDGSTIAIGYVKRTSTKNTIVLYLVENGALSTTKLYANADSDITGYATYANSAKTITMTVNWDEIPYDTVVRFGKNYVLCSE